MTLFKYLGELLGTDLTTSPFQPTIWEPKENGIIPLSYLFPVIQKKEHKNGNKHNAKGE